MSALPRPFSGARAEVKLLCALAALALVLGASSPRVGLVVGGAAMASLGLAGVPLRALRRGLGGPALLLGTTAGLKVLAGGADVLAEVALLGARVVGACLVLRWLLLATTPASLSRALLRFGVPRDFVEVLGLAARYAELLQQDGVRLMAAARLRLGLRSFRTVGRVAPAIAGTLVVRGTERAEAVARVLALRGYRGELSVGAPEASNPRATLRLCVAGALTVTLASVAGRWP